MWDSRDRKFLCIDANWIAREFDSSKKICCSLGSRATKTLGTRHFKEKLSRLSGANDKEASSVGPQIWQLKKYPVFGQVSEENKKKIFKAFKKVIHKFLGKKIIITTLSWWQYFWKKSLNSDATFLLKCIFSTLTYIIYLLVGELSVMKMKKYSIRIFL